MSDTSNSSSVAKKKKLCSRQYVPRHGGRVQRFVKDLSFLGILVKNSVQEFLSNCWNIFCSAVIGCSALSFNSGQTRKKKPQASASLNLHDFGVALINPPAWISSWGACPPEIAINTEWSACRWWAAVPESSFFLGGLNYFSLKEFKFYCNLCFTFSLKWRKLSFDDQIKHQKLQWFLPVVLSFIQTVRWQRDNTTAPRCQWIFCHFISLVMKKLDTWCRPVGWGDWSN